VLKGENFQVGHKTFDKAIDIADLILVEVDFSEFGHFE
jgi:hypothetical protein